MEDCMDEYNLLAKWLSTPEVLKFYEGRNNPFDLDKVVKKFGPRARGENLVTPCIIEYDEQAVGYIQYYKIDPEEYDVKEKIDISKYQSPYGIDLFIGEPDYWNKGIGSKLMKKMIQYLFEIKKADVIFIDPLTSNKRAIKCYEKSGFKAVGVIEKREIFEGEYKDNLIMSITKSNT
jgi:aminoglycoside 6'-N-acetyltransferase